MGNLDLRRSHERLVNDAISLGQAEERTELLFGRVRIQLKLQPNALETYRNILGDTKSTAKIEVAFGTNGSGAQVNSQSRRHGIERNTCTSDQGLQKHIAGTRTRSVPASGRVKSGFNQSLTGFYFAGNGVTELTFGTQSNARAFRVLPVPVFERRLQRSKIVGIHTYAVLVDEYGVQRIRIYTYNLSRSSRRGLAWFNILVHPKKIVGIILILDPT